MTTAFLQDDDVAELARATRVVLIEDDPELALALRHVLERQHYEVETFADGLTAHDALQRQPVPDLIVLDLWTPAMNGWQFRLEQKRDARLADVPVIAISADRSPRRSTPRASSPSRSRRARSSTPRVTCSRATPPREARPRAAPASSTSGTRCT